MKTIIILSGISYDYLKHRPQHFASYFVKEGYEVLYICITDFNKFNPDVLKTVTTNYDVLSCLFKKNKDGVYVLNNNIYKGNASTESLYLLIEKINEVFFNNHPTYIVTFPEWANYIEKISQNTKLIYDCLDDWEEFSKDPEMGYSELIIYNERKIASLADLVITSSNRLFVKMSFYNENVYYLPNGVWNKEYLSKEKYSLPSDIKSVKKPIIFFMGAIAKWVDTELISFIATKRPEYTFLFVGHARCKLPEADNIIFLGTKKYEELPQYIVRSSVCIIPFKVNNLTAAVTPLKLYEYFAASKPVVTTLMPDIIGISGTRTATTYNDFVNYIDEYLNMNKEEYLLEEEKAKSSAKLFDWPYLLKPIKDRIEKGDLSTNYTREMFIMETIDKYLNFASNDFIKNELLGMYNFLGLFDLSCSLFDFNEISLKKLDFEKLALAFLYIGEVERSEEVLSIYFEKSDKKLINFYLTTLLEKSNIDKNILLEIFLLKLSGNIYESIKLTDGLLDKEQYDPKILGILSSLYLEIGEEEITLQIALKIFEIEGIVNVEQTFDANTLLFLIKYFAERKQYVFAEELCLHLMGINEEWNRVFVSILSDIYVSKYMDTN
ncbi:glycosyltransferase [Rummeliibacillus stabekisii]|uniref:glycosyltransferase n=1 Tax=Rummeliibacillus stabekisii TaxID=241244 RepID=UPI003720CEEC